MTARGLCKAKAQATVEEDGHRLVDKVTAWPSRPAKSRPIEAFRLPGLGFSTGQRPTKVSKKSPSLTSTGRTCGY